MCENNHASVMEFIVVVVVVVVVVVLMKRPQCARFGRSETADRRSPQATLC